MGQVRGKRKWVVLHGIGGAVGDFQGGVGAGSGGWGKISHPPGLGLRRLLEAWGWVRHAACLALNRQAGHLQALQSKAECSHLLDAIWRLQEEWTQLGGQTSLHMHRAADFQDAQGPPKPGPSWCMIVVQILRSLMQVRTGPSLTHVQRNLLHWDLSTASCALNFGLQGWLEILGTG